MAGHECLPGANQGGLPGPVKGGMDALDLKGVHHVQTSAPEGLVRDGTAKAVFRSGPPMANPR